MRELVDKQYTYVMRSHAARVVIVFTLFITLWSYSLSEISYWCQEMVFNHPLNLDKEFIEVTVLRWIVFDFVSPLALVGGFWLALMRLRYQNILQTWKALAFINLFLMLITLSITDIITFVQEHIYGAQYFSTFGPLWVTHTLRDMPILILVLILLSLLQSIISLVFALFFAHRHAVYPLKVIPSMKQPFSLVFLITSLLMLILYAVNPWITQDLFDSGFLGHSYVVTEAIYVIVDIVMPSFTFLAIVSISSQRYLSQSYSELGISSPLLDTDGNTVLSYSPISDDA